MEESKSADQSGNFAIRWIDGHLRNHTQKRVSQYVRQYAVNSDGAVNEELANRIEWEVNRRGEMGKQLDVYEPMRWVGIQTVLSTLLGIGIMAATKKEISRPLVSSLAITTALSNSIQLFRLFPRYDAGLKGGVETAVSMYEMGIKPPKIDQHTTTNGWVDRVRADKSVTNELSV